MYNRNSGAVSGCESRIGETDITGGGRVKPSPAAAQVGNEGQGEIGRGHTHPNCPPDYEGVTGRSIMPIRWDDIPHAEIAAAIHRRLGQHDIGRSAEDSSRHILSRRLASLDANEHRRFIEFESRDLVAHLRCTRDVYREFVEKHHCSPVVEAYWVVLRCAVFPTAIAALRRKVVGYLKLARVPGRDLSLLFGIPTRTCYREGPLRLLGAPDFDDDTPATDSELRTLAKTVYEDTLLWFRDIHDGGAVGRPFGGGPFALDDAGAIRRSWGLGALQGGVTLTAWMDLREQIWHLCAPWSDGLSNLFGSVQEELLSQWRALPPDSLAYEVTTKGRPLSLKRIVVKRSGPKPKPRNQVLREMLSKQPELSCKAVCRLLDSKFAALPTLAHPEFGGRTYDSWEQAYLDGSARNLVQSLISRCRPKAT